MGSQVLFLVLLLAPLALSQVTDFISLDCGGVSNYTDQETGLAWISDSGVMSQGAAVEVESSKGGLQQYYQTRRDFPADDKKYCYSLPTEERRRYIVRATFLYGSTDGGTTNPKFEVYLDATKWATITVVDVLGVYREEMIIRAPGDSIDVCLCCATTGSPFVSTLELRPLNLSIYATSYEDEFFLKVAARVNFGAPTEQSLRYPDDPYDRIWESDLAKRQNFLVGVAAGTERINTTKDIDVKTREYPPVKVMQTAVVGTEGRLSYRLDLEDFPANARAYAYFAEIEDLRPNQTRKFKMAQPYIADYSNAVVNIIENANGSYRLYEPSYMNVSLEFVLSFSFVKTPDSTEGPLLNAIEISKYVPITSKTDGEDVSGLKAFKAISPGSLWEQDAGDPCNPTQWEWVNCSLTSPPRITVVSLSRKNLTGTIPSELQNMEALTELWLDSNSLTGTIPDISSLISLKILHLENNRLSGPLPAYLGSLPSLQELYIQNNCFSGKIPSSLLNRKLIFNFAGNSKLTPGAQRNARTELITGCSAAALVVFLVMLVGTLLLLRNKWRSRSQQNSFEGGDSFHASAKKSVGYSPVWGGHLMDDGIACHIKLSEIETATMNFSKKIGKGSFGPVYYGKMKDGKEVAVKVMADTANQGAKQFVTEVALLSRIHHRNLVPLIGYCEEANQRILVYEYMHNGTLWDRIHDPTKQKHLDWLARLHIAEDAAKGLQYLHGGCNPSIVHRDVKTSNILLDVNMRAKVSDFGLSRQVEEDLTHMSSVARGTVGYLDPEYYANQHLSEKSDVYSFGIVLLELISGRKPISEEYGTEWNIVHWARSLIRKGDIVSMIDPSLVGSMRVESVWRVGEAAIQCIEQHGVSRPTMQEIILAVQDAQKIEKGPEDNQNMHSGSPRAHSARRTLLTSFLEIQSPDVSQGVVQPSAR